MDHGRRRFLVSSGTFLFAVQVLVSSSGCGSEDECEHAGDIDMDGTNLVVTSSCDGDHVHTFTLAESELTAPPPGGVTKETSNYEGTHTHVVSMTQAELATVKAGGMVTKESTIENSHSHQFVISTV